MGEGARGQRERESVRKFFSIRVRRLCSIPPSVAHLLCPATVVSRPEARLQCLRDSAGPTFWPARPDPNLAQTAARQIRGST